MLSGTFALLLGRAFNTLYTANDVNYLVDNLKSPFNNRGSTRGGRLNPAGGGPRREFVTKNHSKE